MVKKWRQEKMPISEVIIALEAIRRICGEVEILVESMPGLADLAKEREAVARKKVKK